MQTSGANSEDEHSEIECFSMLNGQIIGHVIVETHSIVVNKFSDLHWSVAVISRQY